MRGGGQAGYVAGFTFTPSLSGSGVRVQRFDANMAPLAPPTELLPAPKIPYTYPYAGGCWKGSGSSWYPWTYPDPSALWCAEDGSLDLTVIGTAGLASWQATASASITIAGTSYRASAYQVTYGARFGL